LVCVCLNSLKKIQACGAWDEYSFFRQWNFIFMLLTI
jgi:hypothetical protein